jgi:hypothetical protein
MNRMYHRIVAFLLLLSLLFVPAPAWATVNLNLNTTRDSLQSRVSPHDTGRGSIINKIRVRIDLQSIKECIIHHVEHINQFIQKNTKKEKNAAFINHKNKTSLSSCYSLHPVISKIKPSASPPRD